MYEELYHYGVKGMKWGVRRDTRLLASHRRNAKVRSARTDYYSGKIDKETRNKRIREANAEKKKFISDTERKFTNAKSKKETERLSTDISKTLLKEVPDAQKKRGASFCNSVLSVMGTASIAQMAAASIVINPAFAPAFVAAGGVAVAAEVGRYYVTRMGLEKVV